MDREKVISKLPLIKKIVLKTIILFAVLAGLLVVALTLVVSYPEPLRVGLEDYFSQISNSRASINELEKISFVPIVQATLKDMSFHDHQNAANIYLEIDSLNIVSPLKSLLLPTKRVTEFKVKGVKTEAGFFVKHSIILDTIEAVKKTEGDQIGSFIEANGSYTGKNLTFQMALEEIGKYYKFSEAMPFSLTVGDVELNATYNRADEASKIENTVFSIQDKSSTAQDYDLYIDGEYNRETPLTCMFEFIDDIEQCEKYLSN